MPNNSINFTWTDIRRQSMNVQPTLSLSFRERLNELTFKLIEEVKRDPFGILLLSQSHVCLAEILIDSRLPLTSLSEFIGSGIETGEVPPQNPFQTAALMIGGIARLPLYIKKGYLTLDDENIGYLLERVCGLIGCKPS